MTNRGRMRRPHLLEDLPEGWSDRLLKPVGPAHIRHQGGAQRHERRGFDARCTNIYQLTAT
jgi:hypothetical protein